MRGAGSPLPPRPRLRHAPLTGRAGVFVTRRRRPRGHKGKASLRARGCARPRPAPPARAPAPCPPTRRAPCPRAPAPLARAGVPQRGRPERGGTGPGGDAARLPRAAARLLGSGAGPVRPACRSLRSPPCGRDSMGAQAPLRLPAAPPLAVCGYTSVLLLFAFCLPESRASNQPAGGGGDCPGGRGKSINCSGRGGGRPPLGLLPSAALGRGRTRCGSACWGVPGAGLRGRTRVRGAGLGTCVGDGEWPCVSPWVSSGRARAAPAAW